MWNILSLDICQKAKNYLFGIMLDIHIYIHTRLKGPPEAYINWIVCLYVCP